MKRVLFVIFTTLMFLACTSHHDDMVYLRDQVRSYTKDLVQMQLKDHLKRQKDFDLQGQKFTLYIDSTGKPVFWKENHQVKEISVKYKNDNYSIELNDGVITVNRE